MKLQDVILKAMAKKISWIEAAEIAGMSVRNMQRKRADYQAYGYTGLFDQRRGKRSIHRVPMELAETVLELPLVAGPGTSSSQALRRVKVAELVTPAPDRFVTDQHSSAAISSSTSRKLTPNRRNRCPSVVTCSGRRTAME